MILLNVIWSICDFIASELLIWRERTQTQTHMTSEQIQKNKNIYTQTHVMIVYVLVTTSSSVFVNGCMSVRVRAIVAVFVSFECACDVYLLRSNVYNTNWLHSFNDSSYRRWWTTPTPSQYEFHMARLRTLSAYKCKVSYLLNEMLSTSLLFIVNRCWVFCMFEKFIEIKSVGGATKYLPKNW